MELIEQERIVPLEVSVSYRGEPAGMIAPEMVSCEARVVDLDELLDQTRPRGVVLIHPYERGGDMNSRFVHDTGHEMTAWELRHRQIPAREITDQELRRMMSSVPDDIIRQGIRSAGEIGLYVTGFGRRGFDSRERLRVRSGYLDLVDIFGPERTYLSILSRGGFGEVDSQTDRALELTPDVRRYISMILRPCGSDQDERGLYYRYHQGVERSIAGTVNFFRR